MITPSLGLPWARSHAGGPAALAVWFQFRAGPERALGTSLGACPAAARQPQLPQGSLPGVARGVACRGLAPSLILSAPRPTPKRLQGASTTPGAAVPEPAGTPGPCGCRGTGCSGAGPAWPGPAWGLLPQRSRWPSTDGFSAQRVLHPVRLTCLRWEALDLGQTRDTKG